MVCVITDIIHCIVIVLTSYDSLFEFLENIEKIKKK